MLNPALLKDFYKATHIKQFPAGTEMSYSNLTPRGSRIPDIKEVAVFGIQYFIKKYLLEKFNSDFFGQPRRDILRSYQRRMDNALGKGVVNTDHIGALHDLGYLPLEIRALPEGLLCPLRVPVLTIKNTHKDFFWLGGMLETLLINTVWQPMTAATIIRRFRLFVNKYADKTSDNLDFTNYQLHDFSMRGHTSLQSACLSGMGFLLSSYGTDTIPAIDYLEEYYNANSDTEIVGRSIPATEHNIMSFDGKEHEKETYQRLINVVYPEGPLAIVSDTYDYWNALNVIIRGMKDEILSRNGKIIPRGDSGDPVKIIAGDPDATSELEKKGSIRVLWDIFGGHINSKGYKELDPHTGYVYGDGINYDRMERAFAKLDQDGFASTNTGLGIGSYTTQGVTRDTFDWGFKGTAGAVYGELREIFKDPITDSGMKRSAKGLLMVLPGLHNDDPLQLVEHASPMQEASPWNMLRPVFRDGVLLEDDSLQLIRRRFWG